MAVAQNSFTGNGSTTAYNYTFPYLKQSEIKASLDGVVTTAFTHPTATSIQFNTAPGSGVKIKIYRETETSSLAATFYAGSSIKSEDLNDNFTQNLYATQEVTERYVSNLGGTMTGDLILGEDVVVKFEGATDNTYETTLTVADPSADRTITLPNETGTVITSAGIDVIDSAHYVAGSIDLEHMSANSVDSDQYVDGSIDLIHMSANSVDSDQYVDGSIDRVHLSNDIIDGTKIADDVIDSEHYAAGSIDLEHMSANSVDSDQYVNGSIDLIHMSANSVDSDQYVDGSIDHVHLSNDCIDGDNIQDDVINSEHYAAGSIDTEHIADGQITSAKFHADTIVTSSEQAAIGDGSDTSFFTAAAGDARYYRLGSVEEIQSGETWVAADNKVATTSAIDARIVDLVDDVGGFVPIANETSFPNANPDVNNGAGTLISIKALASNLTSNGSGVATIANGNVANNATVTINGLANSTTYASTLGMIVETTTTLHTYTFHRVVPKATEVTTVAGSISNVNTVAGSINNVNTVAGINSNVTTVAGISSNVTTVAGVSSNVTTVAGIASDVTAVAADATDIGAVAAKATEIGRLGTADAVSDLNTLGTTAIVSDLDTCATNISNINNVGGSISNVNSVATNLASVNNFANQYRVASSQPSSSLDAGDLYFDTTANELRVYNGSSWQGGVTATGNLVSKADIGASSGVPGAGSNGQYLKTNGSGTLSWNTINQVTAITETQQTISANYTIATSKNAMSVGDITVASGIVLTIPSNSKYIVIS